MENIDNILTSIKKLLGIQDDYVHFDTDIMMHINSVFLNLQQLGVGPEQGFCVMDKTEMWTDFVESEGPLLNAVISYTYLKVKLLFDPPVSSYVIESINRMISEVEWRIMVAADLVNNGGGVK